MKTIARLDDLTRDDWVQLRTTGIGGSDVAAICGLDPWRSPLDVWLDKTGRGTGFDGNAATLWGNLLEPVVAEHFAATTGLEVSPFEHVLAHDEHAWMLANPDRAVGADGILEIKTTGYHNADEWDDDEVPARALLQLQHYLAVTGRRRGWIAVLINTSDYRHRQVDRDDELVDMLIAREAEFWSYVVADTPPPADGHPRTSKALAALYEHPAVGSQVDLDDLAGTLAALRQVKAEAKELADRQAELENTIKAALGDCETGLIGGQPAVTWKQTTTRRVSTKALKADHPDIAEACTETSTSRRFLVKG